MQAIPNIFFTSIKISLVQKSKNCSEFFLQFIANVGLFMNLYLAKSIIISRMTGKQIKIMIEGISGINDERFEAMLDNLRVKEPQILCNSGNKIVKICVNPKCKVALRCSKSDCKDCGVNVHEVCPTFPLVEITQTLNSRAGKYKEFISKMLKIDRELVYAIQESKKELTSQQYVTEFSPECQIILNKIYQKRNPTQEWCLLAQQVGDSPTKTFSGLEGQQICRRIQQISSSSKDRVPQLLQNYKKVIGKIIQEMTNLKKSIYTNYMQQFTLSSAFLKAEDEESISQLQYLRQALNNPVSMKLLYRGSEHGFRASAFHDHCGNVENTLTLVRTQFGRTIAAFTPYKWHSVPDKRYVSNPAGGSFILALDLKEKLIPIDTTKMICNDYGYGPAFGADGYDMVLFDQCDKNSKSVAGCISSYNTVDRKYQKNQQAYTALSGATNGYTFRVSEYEVFRVVYL